MLAKVPPARMALHASIHRTLEDVMQSSEPVVKRTFLSHAISADVNFEAVDANAQFFDVIIVALRFDYQTAKKLDEMPEGTRRNVVKADLERFLEVFMLPFVRDFFEHFDGRAYRIVINREAVAYLGKEQARWPTVWDDLIHPWLTDKQLQKALPTHVHVVADEDHVELVCDGMHLQLVCVVCGALATNCMVCSACGCCAVCDSCMKNPKGMQTVQRALDPYACSHCDERAPASLSPFEVCKSCKLTASCEVCRFEYAEKFGKHLRDGSYIVMKKREHADAQEKKVKKRMMEDYAARTQKAEPM